MHTLLSIVIGAVAVAGAAATATAAPVTFKVDLTFPTIPGLVSSNIIRDGIRISPNCHIDGGALGLPDPALGFDSNGCSMPGGFNENFLGPDEYRFSSSTNPGALLYVDAFGAPFALRQITIGSQPFIFETNRTSFAFGFGPTTFDFSRNPLFERITYFVLRYDENDPGAPALGFTNLVVTLEKVPLPGSLALVGGAALAYALVRRRQQSGRGTHHSSSSVSAIGGEL